LDIPITWLHVKFNGKTGVVSRKYIFDEDDDSESEDINSRNFEKYPSDDEEYENMFDYEDDGDTTW
jgi:hypothetical protein